MDFELLAPREQGAVAGVPLHEWVLPDGVVWTQFYRTGVDFLVRFPELADFEISGNSLAVTCHPAPGATEDTCRHLFLNQVLPLVLSERGDLVFHASAVEVRGSAVAFVAESGRGKSTLAACFATGGYRFLGDDGLVVRAAGDGFEALPSHPSIRLWKDSEEALIGPRTRTAPPVQYTEKGRFLAGNEMAFCGETLPLRMAYFLGDGSASTPRFQRMGGSDAYIEWVRNSFVLDPETQPRLASHFDRLAVLANRLCCYRLDFPRRFEELGRVRQLIVDHLLETGAAP